MSYSILNESYGRYPEPPEVFIGRLFRVFSWSPSLEFTAKHRNASEDWPGPYQHYEIVGLNHVINVVSKERPLISIGKWKSEPWREYAN